MAAAEEQGRFDGGTDRANEERKLIVDELLESDQLLDTRKIRKLDDLGIPTSVSAEFIKKPDQVLAEYSDHYRS